MKASSATPFFKLLGPVWTRTFRNVWMLEELGLQYDLIEKEAMPQSRLVKQFEPSGKVPVLLEYESQQTAQQEGSIPIFVLTESAAINTYLGDAFAEHDRPDRFVPSANNLHARARYDATVSCILSELDAQGLWIDRKHNPSSEVSKFFGVIPEAAQAAQAQFERMHQRIAQPLANQPYLLGNSFSAADILYVHCLDWAKLLGWDIFGQLESEHQERWIHEYLNRCHARPAYQRVRALLKATPRPVRKSQNEQHSKI